MGAGPRDLYKGLSVRAFMTVRRISGLSLSTLENCNEQEFKQEIKKLIKNNQLDFRSKNKPRTYGKVTQRELYDYVGVKADFLEPVRCQHCGQVIRRKNTK